MRPEAGTKTLASLRKRAEKRLRLETKRLEDLSAADLKTLAHELGTHQIELEMQNEELRRAQEELEDSRRRYADLYDYAPIGYVTFDEQGLIRDANLAAGQMLGRSKRSLLNKPAKDFVGVSDWKAFHAHLAASIEKRTRQTIELSLMRADASLLPVQLQSIAVEDGDGSTVVRTSISDITELKRAEAALRESEGAHRTLAQNVPDIVYRVNLQQRVTQFFNNRIVEVTGYRPEELGTGTICSLDPHVVDTDRQRVIDTVKRAIRDRSSFEVEYRFRHKDGRIITLLERSTVVGDKAGVPVFIDGIIRDITGRKQAEEALRRSEERFRAIASSTPDHLLVQDRELRYTLVVNPQLGLTERDMLGKTDYDFLPREEADKLTAIKRDVLEKGNTVHIELPIHSRQGARRFFEGSYVPKFGSRGNVDGLIGYFRDVTDRRLAVQALHESEEKLKLFIEHAPAALAMFNREMRYLSVSKRWMTDYGLGDRNIIGQSHYDIFPEIPEHWKAAHRRGLAGEVVRSDEDRFERADGSTQWLRWEVRPWHDSTGEVGGIGIFTEDITEQVQSENRLEYLASFPQLNPNPVLETDLAGAITYANPAAENVLALLGRKKTDMRMFLPEDLKEIIAAWDRKSPATVSREIIVDDHAFRVVVYLTSTLHVVRLYAFDITERRRADEALLRSEEKYRSLFDNMINGFAYHRIVLDEKGKPVDYVFLEANAAFERLTGLKREEIIGRRVTEVLPGIEKDPADWIGAYGKVALTGQDIQFDQHADTLGRWYSVSAYSPVKGHFATIFEDISARKRAEEALRKSEEQFRRAIQEAPIPVIMHAEDGEVLQVSRTWTELTAYSIEDIRSFDEWTTQAVYGDGGDEVRDHLKTLFTSSSSSTRVDFAIRTKTGEIRHWSFSASIPGQLADGRRYVVGMALDITDRKRSEDALRESEKKFSFLFQKAGFGAALATFPEGVFVDVNEAAERMFGYSRQEVLGKTSLNLDLYPDPGMRSRILAQFIEQGVVRDAEVTMRTKSREERSFLMNMIGLEFGGRKHYIVTLLDITARKLAEEALQRSHQKMEERVQERTIALQEAHAQTIAILESIRDGFYTLDADWRLTYVNTEATRIWDMQRSDLMGRTFWEIAPKARGTVYEEMFHKALREHLPVVFEARSPIAGHLVEVRAYPAGSGLSVFFHDITERRKAEEERRLLESAVDSTAEAIAITDRTGVIQFVNPAFVQVTGYSRAEAQGRTLHILDSGQHDEAFFQAIRSELARKGVWQGRMINRKKDGARYFEDCVISTVRQNSGDIVNYISIRRDVTERIRLESIAAAMNTTENIGYVFAGVRHEIGNPINTAKLNLSFLKETLDKASREDIAENIESALNELQRVEVLLASLRTFNLYETPAMQAVETGPFLVEFVRLVRRDLVRKHITLTSNIGGGAERLFADPRVLHQVLLNIITNAVDAVRERETGRIAINAEAEGPIVHIRITDNGCGMTQEAQQRLFRPFATTKPGGTGLGLVIVQRMLAQMGGDIEITSEPGIGTVADLSLRREEHAVAQ